MFGFLRRKKEAAPEAAPAAADATPQTAGEASAAAAPPAPATAGGPASEGAAVPSAPSSARPAEPGSSAPGRLARLWRALVPGEAPPAAEPPPAAEAAAVPEAAHEEPATTDDVAGTAPTVTGTPAVPQGPSTPAPAASPAPAVPPAPAAAPAAPRGLTVPAAGAPAEPATTDEVAGTAPSVAAPPPASVVAPANAPANAPVAAPSPARVAAPAPAPVAAPSPAPVAAPSPAPVAAPSPARVAAPAPAPVAAPAPAPVHAPAPPPVPAAAAPVAPPAAPTSPSAGEALVLAPQEDRRGWMAKLRQGLSKTRSNLSVLFLGARIDDALYEELETALLTSDAGIETTSHLLEALRQRVRENRLTDAAQVRDALRQLLVELLMPLEQPVDIDRATPLVLMIAGVNGAGKTTSIGKLAHHLQREGKSILLAAGDTFRAAAREQLAEWGARNNVQVIAQQGGDPAAVAFDAVAAGKARGTGVVMVDTAGRLPTQTHLMDELKKIRRVIAKAMPDAPHESLLVLDGNTGQNMLAQVKAFDDAVRLTGLIVTKLDGTAKGGALVALAHTRRDRPIPVYFIGVGEALDDLQAFSAEEFASALVD